MLARFSCGRLGVVSAVASRLATRTAANVPAKTTTAAAAKTPAVVGAPNTIVTIPSQVVNVRPLLPIEQLDQAPNRSSTWTATQRERSEALSGPRFEQMDLAAQPKPLAAIQLIAEAPIVYVNTRIAVCNGGHGALGHPRVYINVDQPGAHACKYCGVQFEKVADHH